MFERQVRAMTGDEVACRAHCQALLELHTGQKLPAGLLGNRARVCSFLPDAVEDYTVLLEGARQAAEGSPTTWWAVYAAPPVLYRTGRFVEALEVLEQAAPSRGPRTIVSPRGCGRQSPCTGSATGTRRRIASTGPFG